MKNIRDLLLEGDPLRHEPKWSSDQQHLRRKAILDAASGDSASARVGSRTRLAVSVSIIVIVIGTSFFGLRAWSPFVRDLRAAVLFEVRLAEDQPAPGLREAKVSGSDRLVYLHEEVIVTNSDIAEAEVVRSGNSSQYGVAVKFIASGAEKMRAATENHIGKPVAILIDGQIAIAPVVRTPIDTSAVISGNYTRAEAERIVNGIQSR